MSALDGELLRRIVEAMPGGVVRVLKDGSVVHANSTAAELLGLRYDELEKRHVVDFATETFHENGSPCAPEEYPVSIAIATGQPAGPLTLSVRRPGGEVRWAVFRAVPTFQAGVCDGAVATFLDVTENKRTEAALRASEEKWRTLIESLPDFIVVVDNHGNIESINRVLSQFDAASIVGTPAESYIDPSNFDAWRVGFERARDERVVGRHETRGQGPDGRTAWYETLFVPLPGADGERRVILVARDVTERRLILSSLAEKERLASVGMVASSVAHEVMNPLTYVLANLDLAKRELPPENSRIANALAQAHEGAMRMRQIVWDLRSLGRSGGEELLYVDSRSVMDTAVRLSGLAAERTTEIEVELVDLPGVLANESQLCQVFINLLLNAAQAMDHLSTEERKIRVGARVDSASELVGIDVKDRGCGIAPDRLGRIFEAFYTTKKAGTGLGLSISRDIVERMRGRLEVASELGQGTTFTVWLPTKRPPVTA